MHLSILEKEMSLLTIAYIYLSITISFSLGKQATTERKQYYLESPSASVNPDYQIISCCKFDKRRNKKTEQRFCSEKRYAQLCVRIFRVGHVDSHTRKGTLRG